MRIEEEHQIKDIPVLKKTSDMSLSSDDQVGTSFPFILKDLPIFEKNQIPLGPKLGERLENTPAHIACFIRESESDSAAIYRQIIDRRSHNFTVLVTEDPIASAFDIATEHVIPIVITSAVDPKEKDIMFLNPTFGEMLADRFPIPNRQNSKATPILHCVGITRHGIKVLAQENNTLTPICTTKNVEQKRSDRIKDILGNRTITPVDFHNILQSKLVKGVTIHVLGPAGTDMSQAAQLYMKRMGISNKTNIIVYGPGIIPLEYARIAAEETRRALSKNSLPETLDLHLECAAYDGMGKLYQERSDESIFIDEQDMALDSIQLASQLSMNQLRALVQRRGKIRLTTHPSPKSLISPWIARDVVQCIEVSSKSVAALMVVRGEADACITNALTVTLLAEQNMHTLHKFGSPNMIFTIASPLSHKALRRYLNAEGSSV